MLHKFTSVRRLRIAEVIAGALLVIAVAGDVITATVEPAAAQSRQVAAAGGDYLPLAIGNRWELRSSTSPNPMVLEVVDRDDSGYIVRWDNPWVKARFRFEDDGTRIRLTGLDMGQGLDSIPRETVYWDFSRREGERWTSAVGTQRITQRGNDVTTPSGRYTNTIEIETRDQQGMPMYWTFAPGVGLVRFGQGRDAFLLASSRAAGDRESTGRSAAPRQAAARDDGDYLPLAIGNRWELRSRTSKSPMVLEVLEREGNAYVVRWDNPWTKATFRFEDDGGRIRMTGLDMGQGLSQIPGDTVYWDFERRQGERWTSQVGTQRVTERGQRVSTPAGQYNDTIEIETRDQQGMSMYWTFAPGVGLVRFGQGRDAFLLSSMSRGEGEARSAPTPVAPPRTAPPSRTSRSVLIGVDPNPPANATIDDAARRRSFRTALDAGMNFHYILPNWNSIERSAGRFDFADVDLHVSMAEQAKVPIALNIRVLDAGQRAMPKEYQGWNLDDNRMVEKLNALLRAAAPRFKGRVRWITLGNEVDSYFNAHRDDIARYARLIERVTPTVRDVFPGAPLSVNFTSGAASQMDRYRSIVDRIDIVSFSYYPLNADFSMKAPSVAGEDIGRMVEAAGSRDVLFQEIGYASAERLNSSQAKQAEFLEHVFAALRTHADKIVHARILFMSDLPQSVVDTLASYYKAPNSENFKAYLETLGLFDQRGRPKQAWRVFEREARALSERR